jgi:hypothetical protein
LAGKAAVLAVPVVVWAAVRVAEEGVLRGVAWVAVTLAA